jgi:BirA family transcriptional regulator, biotin operon repressor / biotin---[acetyl-CoA-carboxylase] ligase
MTTDAKILSALRRNPGGVSGAQLGEQLAISRAAVWSRIKELRQVGYEIEAGPHFGYRLVSSPDALHADDLLARLTEPPLGRDSVELDLVGRDSVESKSTTRAGIRATLSPPKIIGRDIQVFKETTSTNDVIEKLARDGVREGVVVFAESQTRGRGRLGRKWISPAHQGLWFSILLRPDLRPQETTQLTVASATALRRAIIAQTGLRPEIKWPNDILIGGKKVAGILTELSAELDRVKHIILGIGVDVNVAAAELPPEVRKLATSLKIEAGAHISRVELAAEILRELDRDYARICAGKFSEVADEWEAGCATIGKNVTVQMGDRKISGCAESLDEDGALLVRTQHGHLERVIGGDVTLEK